MFEPTVRKLVAIHSIRSTDAGSALIEYADGLIETAHQDLVHKIRADDFAAVAGAQAVVKLLEGFKWLLQSETEDLLTAYGLELEEEAG